MTRWQLLSALLLSSLSTTWAINCGTISACPLGFNHKGAGFFTRNPTCAGDPCTNDECCAPNQRCSGFTCPSGWLRDSNKAGETCREKECDEAECCKAAPSCKPFPCPSGFTKLGTGFFSSWPKCRGDDCLQSECCKPNQTCGQFRCPAAGTFSGAYKSNPAVSSSFSCKAEECDKSECCVPLPTCKGFGCETGQTLIGSSLFSKYPNCRDTTCTGQECCRDNQKCSVFTCPNKFIRKEAMDPNMKCKDEKCDKAECCDELPTCKNWSAPCDQGRSPKGDPGFFSSYPACRAVQCTEQECCKDNGKCSAFRCDDKSIKTDGAPEACAGVECKAEECCTPLPTCKDFPCSPEMIHKGQTGILFWKSHLVCRQAPQCAETECCDLRARCDSFQCAQRFHPMEPLRQEPCAGTKCEQTECCQPNQTCGTHQCQQDTHLATARTSTQCLSWPTCTNQECCDMNGKCLNFNCPTNFHYDQNAAQRTCEKLECPYTECCLPNPVCGTHQCLAQGYHIKQDAVSSPCKGQTCLDGDCCEANQRCNAFKCPLATFHSIPTQMQVLCQEALCRQEECCEANPTCDSPQTGPFQCQTNYHTIRNAQATICKDAICENAECCVVNPFCTSFTNCPAMTHLKATAATFYCATATCTDQECCQPNPTCGTFKCPALMHDRPNVSQQQCTTKDCLPKDCCDDNPKCPSIDCAINGGVPKPASGSAPCAQAICVEKECCDPPVRTVSLTWNKQELGNSKPMPYFGYAFTASPPGLSQTFTIKNAGNVDLNIKGLTLEQAQPAPSDGDYVIKQPSVMKVGPGGKEVTFTVVFAPKSSIEIAERSVMLLLATDDTNGNEEIKIKLTGKAASQRFFVYGKDGKEKIVDKSQPNEATGTLFGEHTANTVAKTATFFLKNRGETLLTLGSPLFRFEGADAAKFKVFEEPESKYLGVDQMVPFTISFSPDSVATFSATVFISSSDPELKEFSFGIGGLGLEPCDTIAQGKCEQAGYEVCKQGSPACGDLIASKPAFRRLLANTTTTTPPPKVAVAKVCKAEGSWPQTADGAKAALPCRHTYEGKEALITRLCQGGTWAKEVDACFPPKSCAPENVKLVASMGSDQLQFAGVRAGGEISAPCPQGMVGDVRRTCLAPYASWSPLRIDSSCTPTGPCDQAALDRCAALGRAACDPFKGPQCGEACLSGLFRPSPAAPHCLAAAELLKCTNFDVGQCVAAAPSGGDKKSPVVPPIVAPEGVCGLSGNAACVASECCQIAGAPVISTVTPGGGPNPVDGSTPGPGGNDKLTAAAEDSEAAEGGMGAGAIAGIIIGVLVGVGLVGVVAFMLYKRHSHGHMMNDAYNIRVKQQEDGAVFQQEQMAVGTPAEFNQYPSGGGGGRGRGRGRGGRRGGGHSRPNSAQSGHGSGGASMAMTGMNSSGGGGHKREFSSQAWNRARHDTAHENDNINANPIRNTIQMRGL